MRILDKFKRSTSNDEVGHTNLMRKGQMPAAPQRNRFKDNNYVRVKRRISKSKCSVDDNSLDPKDLKPQEFKVGYLYKREGSGSTTDYKTKRHFRLSSEGGLKIYKYEQDKTISPLEDISLDFVRCELQAGITDLVSPPRYHFCLKSDDMFGNDLYLAAESDYVRRKWMVSIARHVDLYCKSPVKEANEETREYLGHNLNNTDDTTDSDSDDESESSSSHSREEPSQSRNIVQITAPDPVDDEIYGDFEEFDFDLHNSPEQEAIPVVPGISLCEPRRGSVDRKTSTTTFTDLDTGRPAMSVMQIVEENDDTYMAAEEVCGSSFTLPARPRSAAVGSDPTSDPLMSSRSISTEEDDLYVDGFSLARTKGINSPVKTPSLPSSKPPSLTPPAVPLGPPPPLPLESDSIFSDDENIYADGTDIIAPALEVPTYINTAELGRPPRSPLPPRSLPPKPPL